MRLVSSVVLALSMIAGPVACTTRLVDFTMISTKNVDLSRGASFTRGPRRIEGIDMVHMIIFIPTGVPNMKEAIDRAIESVPGAVALMDGVVSQKAWWIPLIYGQSMFIVEGTPLVDPSLVSEAPIGRYLVATMDRDGMLKAIRAVTESEYREIKTSRFPHW